MSILFVLLTFLLILSVMYFRRPEEVSTTSPVGFPKDVSAPTFLKQAGFEVPKHYCFHPGHTWVLDEGRQTARVGIDAFAGNLFGKIDAIEMAELNRWVRQGQKLCTVKREGHSVELLSPIEGVLVSVNHEALKDPNLISEDPYKNGWLCVVKAPELATNVNNLLKGPIVLSFRRSQV
jgi:glycine cleavage system H protein